MKQIKIVLLGTMVLTALCPVQAGTYVCAVRVSSFGDQPCNKVTFATATVNTLSSQLVSTCVAGPAYYAIMNPGQYRLPGPTECLGTPNPDPVNNVILVRTSTQITTVANTCTVAGKCGPNPPQADACSSSPQNTGWVCALTSNSCGGTGGWYDTQPDGYGNNTPTNTRFDPNNHYTNVTSWSISGSPCMQYYYAGTTSPTTGVTCSGVPTNTFYQ